MSDTDQKWFEHLCKVFGYFVGSTSLVPRSGRIINAAMGLVSELPELYDPNNTMPVLQEGLLEEFADQTLPKSLSC